MHFPRLFTNRKDWLVAGLLIFVFLVGGASRADVTSLLVLRPVAACAAVWFAFQLNRDQWRDIKIPLALLGAAIVVVALQLVPLPPEVWHSLPERAAVIEVDKLAGLGEPWRPLSLMPPDSRNALVSLIVPLAVLLAAASLDDRGRRALVTILLALVGISVVVSVMQLGGGSSSLFYFYKITNKGMMVGLFSNRNHNAMLIACALPMIAVKAREWMQVQGESGATKLLIGLAGALALLPILAVVGSRMGFLTGVVGALAAAFILARNNQRMREFLRNYRMIILAAGAVAVGLLTIMVTRFGSAVQRTTSMDSSEIRFGIWKTSWELVKTYFPVGSGFGSFPAVYKAHEPISTIEPSYVNHVHSDFIEILIDGGVAGALLLAAALALFAFRFAKLSFAGDGARTTLGLLGGSIILIMMIGSTTDYPLRVPSIMGLVAVASLWLFARSDGRPRSQP